MRLLSCLQSKVWVFFKAELTGNIYYVPLFHPLYGYCSHYKNDFLLFPHEVLSSVVAEARPDSKFFDNAKEVEKGDDSDDSLISARSPIQMESFLSQKLPPLRAKYCPPTHTWASTHTVGGRSVFHLTGGRGLGTVFGVVG